MNEQEIQKYKNDYYKKHGRMPDSIPMTQQELAEFNSNSSIFYDQDDLEIQIHHWAPEQRYKRLSLEYAIVEEQATIDKDSLSDTHFTVEDVGNQMKCSLQARILSDTEQLSIEIECDPWAKWKKIFNIKPKKKKIAINARTLYHRMAVKFPENSHSVQFHVLEK